MLNYSNEISPRAGLLRVREFEMAEIEHFVNPEKRKTFHKFDQVEDLQISFYSACQQMEGKPPSTLRLGDAVKQVSLLKVLSTAWLLASFCCIK